MKRLVSLIIIAMCFASCEYTGTETLTVVVHYPNKPDTMVFTERGFGTTLDWYTKDGASIVWTQGPNPETIFTTTAPLEEIVHTYTPDNP